MADWTSKAREIAWVVKARFTAVADFLLDQAGAILTDQSGEPLLTQMGYSGTPVKATARRSFASSARNIAWTSNARTSWTAKERI